MSLKYKLYIGIALILLSNFDSVYTQLANASNISKPCNYTANYNVPNANTEVLLETKVYVGNLLAVYTAELDNLKSNLSKNYTTQICNYINQTLTRGNNSCLKTYTGCSVNSYSYGSVIVLISLVFPLNAFTLYSTNFQRFLAVKDQITQGALILGNTGNVQLNPQLSPLVYVTPPTPPTIPIPIIERNCDSVQCGYQSSCTMIAGAPQCVCNDLWEPQMGKQTTKLDCTLSSNGIALVVIVVLLIIAIIVIIIVVILICKRRQRFNPVTKITNPVTEKSKTVDEGPSMYGGLNGIYSNDD